MSDFNIKVDWKDAPPAVQEWYLQQVERAEAIAAQEAASEAEKAGVDGPIKRDPFQPQHLTREDGTVYRPDPVVSDPNDGRYRDHMRETLKRLMSER